METAALKQLCESLQRYGGWLDRAHQSAIVRADIEALGTAIEARANPSSLLEALEIDLARLPGGEVRKMLRLTAGRIRRALAEPQ